MEIRKIYEIPDKEIERAIADLTDEQKKILADLTDEQKIKVLKICGKLKPTVDNKIAAMEIRTSSSFEEAVEAVNKTIR